MQEQERIRDGSYRFALMPNIWTISVTENVSAARQRQDNKLSSRYWNLLPFNVVYVDFLAFITSLLIFLPGKKQPMMKRSYLNFMKSVF